MEMECCFTWICSAAKFRKEPKSISIASHIFLHPCSLQASLICFQNNHENVPSRDCLAGAVEGLCCVASPCAAGTMASSPMSKAATSLAAGLACTQQHASQVGQCPAVLHWRPG